MFPLLAAIFALPFVGVIFSGAIAGALGIFFVSLFMKQIITIIALVFFVYVMFKFISNMTTLTGKRAVAYIALAIGFLTVPLIMNSGIFTSLGIGSYSPIAPVNYEAPSGSWQDSALALVQFDGGLLVSLILSLVVLRFDKNIKHMLGWK